MHSAARPATPSDLQQLALRLLARREHSRRELQRKLAERFPDADGIGAVLDDLAARNLQSDDRYAEQYVCLRAGKGYGPLRIRAELENKGIARQTVDLWLESATDDWSDNLRAAARQKFGNAPPADRREQAKRARYLEYRGFPISLIRGYLSE